MTSQQVTVVQPEKVSGGSNYSRSQYQGPRFKTKLKKIMKPKVSHQRPRLPQCVFSL